MTIKRNVLIWISAILAVGAAAWGALAVTQGPAFYGPGTPASSRLFEGSISEIAGASAAPLGVTVAGKNGSVLQLVMDPQETVVLQGGRVTEAGQLEKGQQVKVRYALKDGKEVARSIEITDPLPMLAPKDKPEPVPPKPMSEF